MKNKLEKINDLAHFPWVGKTYPNTDEKWLFVEEFHYSKAEKNHLLPSHLMEQNLLNTPPLEFHEQHIRYITHLLKENFQKEIYSEAFFQQVAFYPFIQKTMADFDERPLPHDIEKAWSVFFQLISILQPTHCLLIGNMVKNAEKIIEKYNIPITTTIYGEKIEKVTPVQLSIKIAEQSCNLYFINPTDIYFPKFHLQNVFE